MENKEMTIEKSPAIFYIAENEIRSIENILGKFVRYIFHDANDVSFAFFSYHPELVKILLMDCIYPYSKSGELMFKILKDGQESFSCGASLIAIGCYTGMVKADTFYDDIQRLNAKCLSNSVVVHHVNNKIYNDDVDNLIFMDVSTNEQNKRLWEIGSKLSSLQKQLQRVSELLSNEITNTACNLEGERDYSWLRS